VEDTEMLGAKVEGAAQNDIRDHRLDIAEGDTVFINLAKKDRDGYKAVGIVSRKLGPQRAGPLRVLEMVGENACRVDIPNDWRIGPVISLRNLTKAPSELFKGFTFAFLRSQ
jgi:hypothetical protein